MVLRKTWPSEAGWLGGALEVMAFPWMKTVKIQGGKGLSAKT